MFRVKVCLVCYGLVVCVALGRCFDWFGAGLEGFSFLFLIFCTNLSKFQVVVGRLGVVRPLSDGTGFARLEGLVQV